MQDSRIILDSDNTDNEVQADSAGSIAAWTSGLRPDLIKSLASESALATTLGEAILNLIRKRFCNLSLVPLDKVDNAKPLFKYRVDSMIAAEFRTWFWSSFKMGVSFLEILSSTNSLSSLAGFVEDKLIEEVKQCKTF